MAWKPLLPRHKVGPSRYVCMYVCMYVCLMRRPQYGNDALVARRLHFPLGFLIRDIACLELVQGRGQAFYFLRLRSCLSSAPPPRASLKLPSICKSALQAVLSRECTSPFMRLTGHLATLRAWCKLCLPGR